jgi:uncharacterized protein
MRWKRGTGRDVIDARGGGGRGGGFGGGGLGGGRMPIPGGARMGGGLGVVGIVVFLALQLLGGGSGFQVPSGFEDPANAPQGEPIPASQDPERDLFDFSSYVFTDAQDTWEKIFADAGQSYDRAQMKVYRNAVSTGCGGASSSVGPFYCPADQRVYLDLSFYRDMETQLRASGDFAWAYVIAHEVGHHVQNLLGIAQEVQSVRQQVGETEANALSVMMELQADCLAGMWAHHTERAEQMLERGDIEEGLDAAAAIGDDRLQRQAQGYVVPDAFTHGSSAQRVRWFREGLDSGNLQACDTFSAERL